MMGFKLGRIFCYQWMCSMHLDICACFAGTASVAVAGVIAAMRITKTRVSDHKFLFQGAGEVSILPVIISVFIPQMVPSLCDSDPCNT